MRNNGFVRDAGKTMKLQAPASLSWMKSNINVYVRNANSLLGIEIIPPQWLS
jgi:hypothetical protein